MSVHGEYARALEAILTSLRQLGNDSASQWIEALESARNSQHADLSSAAKACLIVLESIDHERHLSKPAGVGPEADPLREPFQHLLAHCRALLGGPDASSSS